MKICIDLRSLSTEQTSGVENYCFNLSENLLEVDKKNSYTFFWNSFRNIFFNKLKFSNSRSVAINLPRIFLNFAFKTNLLYLEKFIGEQDWIFLPNLNQFCISKKTKLALTVHDLSPVVYPEFYNIKRQLWHKYLNYKSSFARANLIFAVSEYTKVDLMRVYGVPEEKIKVVYPSINKSVFSNIVQLEHLRELRNIYNLPKEYFLCLNTLEPRKNLLGVIEAFGQAKINAHLVLAGKKGWKYKNIFSAIKKNPKKNKILYLGYIPQNHKVGLIKMSTAVLYPSFYEGFGFQPLEAMTVGVPVIATALTSVPEVVADSGILVNPHNINDLSYAMEQLDSDENFKKSLVLKGLKRSEQFSWHTSAKKILSYLENF